MDKTRSRMSATARIDKRNVQKARHFVRIDGVWEAYASKTIADRSRASRGGKATIYAQGMSLSAIRELIERSK